MKAIRNAVLGLGLCLMSVPLFAAQTTPGQSMPQALQLQAVQGAQTGVYQDSFGNTFTVQPESGGSLCDPNGCMVQVCNKGACTYYYCTVTGCKQVSIGASG